MYKLDPVSITIKKQHSNPTEITEVQFSTCILENETKIDAASLT